MKKIMFNDKHGLTQSVLEGRKTMTQEEPNAPTEYGKYVDECLNDAAKHFFSDGEDKYSVADLFYAGVRCGQSWFEKQNEKTVNDANKVEPKFKDGDWIIFNGFTLYVKEVVNGFYRTINQDGITNSYDWNIDYAARLWSIDEAKDGNVLVCVGKHGQEIGIIKEYAGKIGGCDKCFKTYCFVDWEGEFRVGDYMGSKEIHPATKEQRGLLFQKMKESGYGLDSDKKELIKL